MNMKEKKTQAQEEEDPWGLTEETRVMKEIGMKEPTMKIDTTEMIILMKEMTDKKEEKIEMKNIEVT